MAIRVTPEGEAGRMAEVGKIVGQAQAAQQRIEQAVRTQERLASIEAQKELAIFNHQLQLDRAKYHAYMDFEGERRAREWELEKMEMSSRLDFQQEEKKRLEDTEKYNTGVEIIENSNMPDFRKEQALFDLSMKFRAGYVPSIPAEKEERLPSEADIARAAKYLSEYEEPGRLRRGISKITRGLLGAKAPTPQEKALKTHYERLLGEGLRTESTFPAIQPIYQENVRTGQRRVSYDGGKSWQMIG